MPSPIATQSKPNWWKRNWKWFVPTGCLTILALFAAFIISIVLFAFGMMKSTDIYKDALAKAQAEPAVVEALGSPIKDGLIFSGKTEVNGASGEANLAIPISGPKGEATIYAVAEKSAGVWNYSILAVEIKGSSERIDLLHERE